MWRRKEWYVGKFRKCGDIGRQEWITKVAISKNRAEPLGGTHSHRRGFIREIARDLTNNYFPAQNSAAKLIVFIGPWARLVQE